MPFSHPPLTDEDIIAICHMFGTEGAPKLSRTDISSLLNLLLSNISSEIPIHEALSSEQTKADPTAKTKIYTSDSELDDESSDEIDLTQLSGDDDSAASVMTDDLEEYAESLAIFLFRLLATRYVEAAYHCAFSAEGTDQVGRLPQQWRLFWQAFTHIFDPSMVDPKAVTRALYHLAIPVHERNPDRHEIADRFAAILSPHVDFQTSTSGAKPGRSDEEISADQAYTSLARSLNTEQIITHPATALSQPTRHVQTTTPLLQLKERYLMHSWNLIEQAVKREHQRLLQIGHSTADPTIKSKSTHLQLKLASAEHDLRHDIASYAPTGLGQTTVWDIEVTPEYLTQPSIRLKIQQLLAELNKSRADLPPKDANHCSILPPTSDWDFPLPITRGSYRLSGLMKHEPTPEERQLIRKVQEDPDRTRDLISHLQACIKPLLGSDTGSTPLVHYSFQFTAEADQLVNHRNKMGSSRMRALIKWVIWRLDLAADVDRTVPFPLSKQEDTLPKEPILCEIAEYCSWNRLQYYPRTLVVFDFLAKLPQERMEAFLMQVVVTTKAIEATDHLALASAAKPVRIGGAIPTACRRVLEKLVGLDKQPQKFTSYANALKTRPDHEDRVVINHLFTSIKSKLNALSFSTTVETLEQDQLPFALSLLIGQTPAEDSAIFKIMHPAEQQSESQTTVTEAELKQIIQKINSNPSLYAEAILKQRGKHPDAHILNVLFPHAGARAGVTVQTVNLETLKLLLIQIPDLDDRGMLQSAISDGGASAACSSKITTKTPSAASGPKSRLQHRSQNRATPVPSANGVTNITLCLELLNEADDNDPEALSTDYLYGDNRGSHQSALLELMQTPLFEQAVQEAKIDANTPLTCGPEDYTRLTSIFRMIKESINITGSPIHRLYIELDTPTASANEDQNDFCARYAGGMHYN